jgi:hypothetical protein
MRRLRPEHLPLGLLAALLGGTVLVSCPVPPRYEGDVVLGSFAFNATLDVAGTTCPGLPDGGSASSTTLGFVGVFSLDSLSQQVYLRVNELDRQGALDAGSFVLVPPFAVERDLGCDPLSVTETIRGAFALAGPRDAGCPLLTRVDGSCFAPSSLDGFVDDEVTPVDGGGVRGGSNCAVDAGPTCVFRYVLHGVRQ